METKLKIMNVFFQKPFVGYHIREIAKITNINHTTVRKYLRKYEQQSLLLLEKNKPYNTYKANVKNRGYLQLKLYYNLRKLTGLLKELEVQYDFPVIVLFGSYSRGQDDQKSDIDLFLLTETKKEIGLSNYEKQLGRKISLHLYNQRQWNLAKKKNPSLVNNICNGIVLSGKLRFL